MAIQVLTPRGGWSRIQPAVDYTGITSRYGALFQQAKEEEENNLLREKVLAYSNGDLSYEELKAFIEAQLKDTPEGSGKSLDLREALVDLENTNRTKKKASKLADLQAKFAKDGISADEQLEIEEEMLTLEKPGTPEYQQQLARIATARENAEEEARQEQIASFTAQLAQGGITREEEIQVYEEMLKTYQPGTLEYSQALAKLEETKALLADENQAEAFQSRRAELVEQYKEGGITSEERLDIVRELRQLVPPGSEAERELIDEEAKILGEIEAERETAGKGAKAEREAELMDAYEGSAKAEMLRMQRLEDDFERGRITGEEYIRGMGEAQRTISEATQGLVNAGVAVPGESLAEIEANSNFVRQQEEAFDKGQLLAVRNDKGLWTLATLDDLINDPTGEFSISRKEGEEIVNPETGESFNRMVQMRGPGGVDTFFIVTPEGTFKPIQQDKVGNLIVDAAKEYAVVPQSESQIKSFNIAGVQEGDREEFIRRLREEKPFRESLAQAGEAQPADMGMTPEIAARLKAGGFVSPVAFPEEEPETLQAKLTKTFTSPAFRFGGPGGVIAGAVAKPAAKLVSTFAPTILPAVKKAIQTFAKISRAPYEAYTGGPPTTDLGLAKFKTGLEEQFRKIMSSYQMPTFKAPSFDFKMPSIKPKDIFPKRQAAAKSIFQKGFSFIKGLFGG